MAKKRESPVDRFGLISDEELGKRLGLCKPDGERIEARIRRLMFLDRLVALREEGSRREGDGLGES